MKKTLKFVVIIALTAIFGLVTLSCGKTGGTLVIKNNTGVSIISGALNENELQELINLAGTANINNLSIKEKVKIASYISKMKTIEQGKSVSWKYENDINVSWLWAKGTNFLDADINTIKYGNVTIEGGNTVTVTAE